MTVPVVIGSVPFEVVAQAAHKDTVLIKHRGKAFPMEAAATYYPTSAAAEIHGARLQ